ncbi:MAG: periplasmic heavy metal sensor [Proteobacteria bacterium]|nr:periplasmic heavy metal sensor [Pseudomonadota bacterium]MBU1138329.1 periplasmic heavy metal sensor [Pseudomonadota bacterium]
MDSIRRQKLTRYGMVLLVTIFLLPAAAGARMHGDGLSDSEAGKKGSAMSHYGIWRDAAMVTTLGLSNEQIQQIKEAEFSQRERGLALHGQLDMLRLQMDKAFASDTPDESSLLAVASQVADLQGQLFIERITARLAMEKLLSAEQREKLKMEYDRHDGRHDNDWHHAAKGGSENKR